LNKPFSIQRIDATFSWIAGPAVTYVFRRFSHVLDSPQRKILVGNGEAIVSSKAGNIELDDRIKLLNVLYVPSCGAIVLSLSMLDKYNLSAHVSNGEVIIGTDSDLDVYLMGKKNNDGLYESSVRSHISSKRW
jgi:hypothetical protein